MSVTDRPTKRDLDQLLEKLRPQIVALFQDHGVSPAEMERLIDEALLALSYRWGRIPNREWWLLDTLGKAAWRHGDPSPKEPGHG